MEKRELETMPYDKMFDGEMCHATGYEVHFTGDPDWEWWNEYEDAEGHSLYGR